VAPPVDINYLAVLVSAVLYMIIHPTIWSHLDSWVGSLQSGSNKAI
jgi:hypothetical protein